MTSRTRIAIVAAAGRGTRFGAAGTKVLADIAGRPCVQRVLDCVEAALGEHHQLLVVGHEAERVVAKVGAAVHRRFVHQPEQRGTGHALAVALAQVDADDADVYFLCGDKPLLRASTLARLRSGFEAQPNGMAFLTGRIAGEPATSRQGRVVRYAEHPVAIVEHKTIAALDGRLSLPGGSWTRDDLLAVREVNVSTYAWRLADLRRLVPALSADAAQAEVLVTDLVRLFVEDGLAVRGLPLDDAREGLGIDTPEQWRTVAALAGEMGVR